MRIRTYKDSNYKAIFFNGKTIRQRLDSSRPFAVTPTPEIEDVAINSKCFANCSYCYTSATKAGTNFDDIVSKAELVWGSMQQSDRPFQIAIGGAGESTIHPDWVAFVRRVNELGIVPNYTTNGMHLSAEILDATERYCGGVAVSYHPHIKNVFHEAVDKLSRIRTKLNAHVIIGTPESLEDLKELYGRHRDRIDYFVVLPYQAAGRAATIDVDDTWRRTFEWIRTVEQEKFAFGALFYEWLQKNDTKLDMSIYEPELFSGYRMMDDTYNKLRRSSYDLREKIQAQS